MAIQQDAIGLTFDIALVDSRGNPVDIRGATTLQIIARPPAGAVNTWTATESSTGINYLRYDTVSGDLDESGLWRYQARVVFADGDDIRSSVQTFEVEENL